MTAPLKWEFPGGKVEDGEGPREALRREIQEELDLTIRVDELLGRGWAPAAGEKRAIVLDVYLAWILGGELKLKEHRQARWLTADELELLDWAAADIPILPQVRRVLEADSPFQGE